MLKYYKQIIQIFLPRNQIYFKILQLQLHQANRKKLIKVNQQYKSLNHNPNLSNHRLKIILIHQSA